MQEKELIINHFNNISSSYDENNKKLYWKLSDDLLWDVIQKYIPKKRKITFLDLGGGTGEWAYKILSKYDNTSCVLVDFSNEMLRHAKEKLSQFNERVKIINCDLNKLNLNEKFDIVLNIYVLPFFYNSEKLIEIVSKHLKKHGISISVGENFYNGLTLNMLKGNINDIYRVQNDGSGKLSEYVPPLHFDKMIELKNIHNKNNIKPIFECGFPVISLIGVQEALTHENNSISTILGNYYDYIFNLEKEYINDKTLCNRGKYICIIGEKSEKSWIYGVCKKICVNGIYP